jgi:hypothetical protein
MQAAYRKGRKDRAEGRGGAVGEEGGGEEEGLGGKE